MSTRVSVVIPSRNAETTIGQTIAAVKGGTYQPAEILVVDGGSTDRTRMIIKNSGATLIDNPKLHAASARRIGVEYANSPIIAFTDSDCIPAPNWLERIAYQFDKNPGLDGLGGRVTLTAPKTDIQAFSAHVFESIKSFPKEVIRIKTKGVGGLSFAGANCAFSRAKVLQIGSFRDEFSNHGEEVDLLWRLVDTGAQLIFDPMLCVEHLGYPDTISKLIRASFRNGTTSTLLTKHHNRSPRIDWSLYRKWFTGLATAIIPWKKDPWRGLLLLELSVFIFAKWYTSIRVRTINL